MLPVPNVEPAEQKSGQCDIPHRNFCAMGRSDRTHNTNTTPEIKNPLIPTPEFRNNLSQDQRAFPSLSPIRLPLERCLSQLFLLVNRLIKDEIRIGNFRHSKALPCRIDRQPTEWVLPTDAGLEFQFSRIDLLIRLICIHAMSLIAANTLDQCPDSTLGQPTDYVEAVTA